MAISTGRPGLNEFHFRRLDKPEEFRSAEEIAAEAGGGGAGEAPVPLSVQRSAQDNGGLVLGAFVDIHLAGFSLAFLGWDGTVLYLYSHLTAVRPAYQNHHVGRRLKLRQREEVLQLGLAEIRWNFDPLRSAQAHLFLRRLGATPDRLLLHYYGRAPAAEGAAEPTDRLRVVWRLSEPRVVDRIGGSTPAREEDEARWRSSEAIVETEIGEHGLRRPTAVSEPTQPLANLEIPFDLELLAAHEPETVRPWRHAVRDAFRAAFDQGYAVEDFAVVTAEHERRGVYLLRRAPVPAPSVA